MNRIDKYIKPAIKNGEGIISCSVPPIANRDYRKLLHDIDVLLTNGVNQILLMYYHPETMYACNMAPAEIISCKNNSQCGAYEEVFFDTARIIRNNFPEVPLIMSGFIQDMICYGSDSFIDNMSKIGFDGLDCPIYYASKDPLEIANKVEKNGMYHIPAYNGSIYKIDDVNQELIKKTLIRANGELFFIPGVSGETKQMHGNDFKDEVLKIRKIQKENGLDGALIGISGINTPEDCKELVAIAGLDGVHFSSAYLKRTFKNETDEQIGQWIRDCKQAMKH